MSRLLSLRGWKQGVTALALFAVSAVVTCLPGASASARDRAGHSVRAAPAVIGTTLGIRPGNDNGSASGFGTVAPEFISGGGDPTSEVGGIHWQHWGSREAVGSGHAIWVWPGWSVADGGVTLRATVVAFGLSECDGRRAYQYVDWFFPGRGQHFDSRTDYEGNLCPGHKDTNKYGYYKKPISPYPLRKCGDFEIAAPQAGEGYFYFGVSSTVSCLETERLTQLIGLGGKWHWGNVRLHSHGWWCGAEYDADIDDQGDETFSCTRGNWEDFSVTASANN